MLMIDYEPQPHDHVSGEEFVALARAVLDKHSTENFHNDWVMIRANYNGLDLEVTRNRQIVDDDHRNSHLSVSNPTTMVSKGEVIRHHGEHCYLTQHLRDLARPALSREVLDSARSDRSRARGGKEAMTGDDLFEGVCALIRVSSLVPSKGMGTKYTNTDFGVKIDQRSSGKGVVFTAKGPGWRFTIVMSGGEFVIERLHGAESDIDQAFTLARLAL